MSVGATASGFCSVIEGCPWRRRRVVGKTDEVIGANVAVFDCSTENPNRTEGFRRSCGIFFAASAAGASSVVADVRRRRVRHEDHRCFQSTPVFRRPSPPCASSMLH
ncbi:hypothetical protein B296_00054582 [Ensete ventricosum]|uniref:Uncharacterized protein n=1 Tax=Ensete ventricosum TaxID=4639 RepID=A0A426XB42_ENSVE|nr:hypothetical protein B296_00054582 [Ensete ventricosum]